MRIVADDHHRAGETVDCLDQGLARIHVEMVGRLVQQQDVRCVTGHQSEEQPRLFAARQIGDLGIRPLLAEPEAAELTAELFVAVVRAFAPQLDHRRRLHVELVGLMLGEITDPQLGRRRHRAGQRLQPPGQQTDQCRLAVAVRADQRDTVVFVEAQGQVFQHRRAVVPDRRIQHAEQRRRQRGIRIGEIECDRRPVGKFRDRLHAFQHLDPRLRLFRLCRLVAEPVDELLDMGALGFLFAARALVLFQPHAPCRLEPVVAALIHRELRVLEMHDLLHHPVQQAAVVADDHDRPVIAAEIFLQPQSCFEIEMVGGLVEQEQIRFCEQQRGQHHAHAPATRKFVEGALLRRFVEPQPRQDARRPRPRAVGILFGETFVNAGNPVRVGSAFGLGVQILQFGIGGQHGIDQRPCAFGRFLARHPYAPARRHGNRSAVGFQLAHDQLQQRRLSGAVAPHQPDTVSRRHRRGRPVEKHPGPDPVGDIFDLQHGARCDTAGA